ncbi:MAG: hypothetical protein R2850_04575 [Bacteroidia bacterium]
MAEILVAFLYLIFLGLITYFGKVYRLSGIPRPALTITFLLKTLLAIFLPLALQWDEQDELMQNAQMLYAESAELYNLAFVNPEDFFRLFLGWHSESPYYDYVVGNMQHWQKFGEDFHMLGPTDRNMIRFHTFFRFLSFNSEPAHLILFNFIVVTGLLLIFKSLPSSKPFWLFAALFFIPSVFIWSSGFAWVSLVLFFAGWVLLSAGRIFISGFYFRAAPGLFLAMVGLSITFPALALSLLLAAICVLLHSGIRELNSRAAKFVIAILVLFAFRLLDQFLLDGFFSEAIISGQHTSLRHLNDSGLATGIQSQELRNTWWSFLRNAPEALFNAVFRPGILDASGTFQWLSAIESAAMFILAAIAIGMPARKLRISEQNMVYLLTIVFIFTSLFIGLGTQIWKDISLRRAAILPIAAFAWVIITDTGRLKAILFEILNIHGNNSNNGSDIRDR